MIIAAFDIASTTGVCDGPVNGKPRLWSWHLRDAGDSRPDRLLMFHRFLCKYFDDQWVDAVVYEAPLNIAVMSRIGAQEATVAFLRGAIGVLEMTCRKFDKPVTAAMVHQARASVLGWRVNKTGANTKARVLAEVRRVLTCPVENDNEADAYVIWAYACALQNPRLAAAYTPLFAQPKPKRAALRQGDPF